MSDENCCGACGYPIHATKDKACDWCCQTVDRIEALTAKLTNLVEKSNAMLDAFCVLETQRQVEAYDSMCATLAEIEGEKT